MQTGTEGGETVPSIEPVERLLRRRSEPLGVIDVRRPQQLYARTAGWVAKRFALLDHWKTHYSNDEGESAASGSFVIAAQGRSMTESQPLPSSPTKLARMATQSMASEPAGAASPLPTAQYRVRRRGVAPQTGASVDASPHSAFWTEGDATTVRSSSSTASAATSHIDRSELRAAELPTVAHHAAPTSSALILPERLAGGVAAESETSGTASAPQTPAGNLALTQPHLDGFKSVMPAATAAVPAQTPVHVSRVDSSAAALPFRLQRTPDEAGPTRGQDLAAAAASRSTAQLPLSESPAIPSRRLSDNVSGTSFRRKPESRNPHVCWIPAFAGMTTEGDVPALGQPPRPSLSGSEDTTNRITNSLAERMGRAGMEASLGKAESPTSIPLVQRQQASRTSSPEAVLGKVGGPPMAVSAEIRTTATTTPHSTMVWRRTAEAPSSGGAFAVMKTGSERRALPLALNATVGEDSRVARQAITTDSAATTSTDSIALMPSTPTPTMPDTEGLDVTRLAAQVGRLLARQLTVERERRGRR